MKKLALVLLLLPMCIVGLMAQEKKNAVLLEGGGAALWYSMNYERRFTVKPMHRITTGVGASFIPTEAYDIFLGLLSVGYLYGEKHNLELGISAGYVFTEPESIGSARIGYRYEAPKGFQFRIGFSPVYAKFSETGLKEYSGKGVLPWGYISVGYAF